MVSERLSLTGDLLERNVLSSVFDTLNEHGVKFRVRRFNVGEFSSHPSLLELQLTAPDQDTMKRALEACVEHGADITRSDAHLVEADMDGVLPDGFHSTTNFTTHVSIDQSWIDVEAIEMDCGIRVWNEEGTWRARTCPMHQVRKGDLLVVGYDGVKITPLSDETRDPDEFRFMSNEISSERPKGRMIAHAADMIRKAKTEGKRVLFVGGPAIVHSGSSPLLAKLIEDGWIDILFAGNALATHDIESNVLGTSLGVNVSTGESSAHGHTHHLRVINRVRRCGSIRKAVEEGVITGGTMFSCVQKGVPFVLCGSIRDDGPLPDVITDNVIAQDEMRKHIHGVGVCLMVATTLHSVAVGNILPASVKTYCVDSDSDTVIKLTDRGTHQAIGLVTDCEYFLHSLVGALGAGANEASGGNV